jgi:hypothetical protein
MGGPDVCRCGREILRASNRGRPPIRCTICRRIPPPPYEDHDREKASAIGPDGWTLEGVKTAPNETSNRTGGGQDSTQPQPET